MITQPANAEGIVGLIEDIFALHGADSYLGEDVTMAEHMLQAAHLAEQQGESESVILAALLHDVGHYANALPPEVLMNGQDNRHQVSGADWLARFFPAEIVEPVRQHVAAKRYLVAVEPSYRACLSQASLDSLALQGGAMEPHEAAAFAQLPQLAAILKVRRLDDAAKVAGMQTPDFAHYKPMLQRWVLAAG
ncbi:HD domain-containing protein [Cobetia sp. 29-18-1]|uniref:HD domain-containing protein n=1 Tax=Cobetia sp. 29-18-1 TaxID=3040018 RepID=UPI00244B66E7|nr:HD domain-containing protein [Cobetia sp. 29-18-1]MDH2298338.1 HD domain-containing protein [Cobetia sp. 29-18-1]